MSPLCAFPRDLDCWTVRQEWGCGHCLPHCQGEPPLRLFCSFLNACEEQVASSHPGVRICERTGQSRLQGLERVTALEKLFRGRWLGVLANTGAPFSARLREPPSAPCSCVFEDRLGAISWICMTYKADIFF